MGAEELETLSIENLEAILLQREAEKWGNSWK